MNYYTHVIKLQIYDTVLLLLPIVLSVFPLFNEYFIKHIFR